MLRSWVPAILPDVRQDTFQLRHAQVIVIPNKNNVQGVTFSLLPVRGEAGWCAGTRLPIALERDDSLGTDWRTSVFGHAERSASPWRLETPERARFTMQPDDGEALL
jgi:hypothetical protein